MPEEIKPTPASTAGLQQSGAPPKAAKPEEDKNPLPPSIRGHRAVPSHPGQSLQNSDCDFDMNTKAKTTDQCVAEHKARLAKAEK